MKKCLIFGINYYAEMLSKYLELYSDIECVGFILNREYIKETSIYGKPLTPFESIKNDYYSNEVSVLVAIGYKNMNNLRKTVYNKILDLGYSIEGFIHPSAHIEYGTCIGTGNIILENANIGYCSKIGNGNVIWNGCNISHHAIIEDFNFLAPSCTLAGKVHIHNNCFIGTNATIKGGIDINNLTLVGAGAYINKTTDSGKVYVPERSICLNNKQSMDFL